MDVDEVRLWRIADLPLRCKQELVLVLKEQVEIHETYRGYNWYLPHIAFSL
jgi:hypothetical protein